MKKSPQKYAQVSKFGWQSLMIAFLGLAGFTAQAQQDVYFLQGPCMHQLFYSGEGANNPPDFSDFHLQLNDSTVLVISVMMTPESRTPLKTPPTNPLGCEKRGITLNEIRDINAAKRTAWFVERTAANTLNRYPVRELALMTETPRYFKWSRATYSVYYDLINQPAPGTVISSADSEVGALFTSVMAFDLNGKELLGYAWDETVVQPGIPSQNVVFIPRLGLYSASDGTNNTQLLQVNNIQIGDFLNDFVLGKAILRNNEPNEPVAPEVPQTPTPPTPPTPPTTPSTPTYVLDNQGYYKVQKGDNLFAIATAFQTTDAEIMRQNNMASNALNIGQRLLIRPQAAPQMPAEPAPSLDASGYYTVQNGDNLSIISKRFNVDMARIIELNNLRLIELTPGQRLLIRPVGTPTQPPVSPPTKPQPPATPPAVADGVHVVQDGESIYNISEKYGVSLGQLMALNALSSFDLKPGQRIIYREGAKVTDPPVRPAVARQGYHIVQPGENLSAIAKRYSTSAADLVVWNNLNDANIFTGQELRVQRPAETPAPPPPSKPAPGMHIVKAGETESSIAAQYGITAEDLIRWNNLAAPLSPGQQLWIKNPKGATPPPVSPPNTPTSPPGQASHVVQKGQTLFAVSRQHGVSVAELRRINKLTSDNLAAGQVLLLREAGAQPAPAKPAELPSPFEPAKPKQPEKPVAAPPAKEVYHVVKKGETLYAISKANKTTPEAIIKLNNLGKQGIQVGQKLRVK